MSSKAIIFLVLIIIFILLIILSLLCLSNNIFIDKYSDLIDDIPLKSDLNTNIKIYVLGTSLNRELYNNISSLIQYNYNYEIICMGENFGGWRWRTKKYLDTIKKHKLEYGNESIIIFIDGYDAFASSDSDDLYEKFIDYIKDKPECKIISGVERGLPGGKQYGNIEKW